MYVRQVPRQQARQEESEGGRQVTYTLYFHGACKPNNSRGHATYGWAFYAPDGKLFAEGSGHVCSGEEATNNVAAYAGLEAGLKFMEDEKLHVPLVVRGDSKLVVNQVNRTWRCSEEHLQARLARVLSLLSRVPTEYEVVWIPRKQNSRADVLSKSVNVADMGRQK